jgi:formate-dependent nitrite reductase membrane component NrfD
LLLLLVGSLAAGAALTMVEITMQHSGHANLAIQNMVRGKMRGSFWISVVGTGMVAPMVVAAIMLATGVTTLLGLIAAVLALMGLWYFEDMWVKAGQSVPLS